MRVLLDTNAVDQKTLLALVADERRKFDGPAIKELTESDLDAAPDQVPSRTVAA